MQGMHTEPAMKAGKQMIPKPSVTVPHGVDLSELVDEWDQFILALSRGASVAGSAKLAGMSTSRAYDRRRSDGEFAERWRRAVEDGTDILEDEAFRRATTGKSDYLLSMLLRARRPEVYSDKWRQQQAAGETSDDGLGKLIADIAELVRKADGETYKAVVKLINEQK